VFKRVRIKVEELSGGTQRPWESSSLKGDFYFVERDGNQIESNSSGIQVKQVKYITGSLELENYLEGILYLDTITFGIQKNTISLIDGIPIGIHDISVRDKTGDTLWISKVKISRNDTFRLATSQPEIETTKSNQNTRFRSALRKRLSLTTRTYMTSGGKTYIPDGRPGKHSPLTAKLLEALRSPDNLTAKYVTLKQVHAISKGLQVSPRAGSFGRDDPGSDFIFIDPGSISNQAKSYALVVGTDQYDEWGDLVNPVYDAKTVGYELENYGFETNLLQNPTRQELLMTLERLADQKYGQYDQLFIYISGHGVFDKFFGQGYIVLKDSQLEDNTGISYISHNHLRAKVDKIPAEHIFLFVDASMDGSLDLVLK
jgi:hypothetical protein